MKKSRFTESEIVGTPRGYSPSSAKPLRSKNSGYKLGNYEHL
jgi:hypothetical protein